MPELSVSINARQRCIIYALLNSESRMTLGTLSSQTGLTSRIIRYNLDTVKTWFRNEGVTLQSRPGFGIEIETSRQNRKRLLHLISQYEQNNLILTRNQRQRISLFELLNANTPITYQNLASNEGFSRSTIVHDINSMQRWLNAYHITLKRAPNTGAYIEGDEISRRLAIINLVREELGEKKWYSIWYNPGGNVFSDKSLPQKLEKYLKGLPFEFSHHIIEHIENMMGRRLALYSRVEIMAYLAVSIDALLHGKNQEIPITFSARHTVELEISNSILGEITRRYAIKVPDTEKEMLAVCLLCAKWEETPITLGENMQKAEFEDLYHFSLPFVDSILATCARQLHPLLRIDDTLIVDLTRHIEPVMFRLKYRLPIINECLDEVINRYPEVYRTAKLSLSEIEKEVGVPAPPEEVAFVAMYLVAALNRLKTKDHNKHPVVLIGDGIRAKTSLLKSCIEYEFPGLEIIGIMDGYMTGESILGQAELVLSLIQSEIPDIHTIHVTPFLSPSEKKQIQNWMTEQDNKSHHPIQTASAKADLVDLLVPKHILFSPSEAHWHDVVHLASQPLLTESHIQPHYVEAMIHIIEEHGPYMFLAPGIIILHARPVDGVNALCLSMLQLQKPVNFGSSENEMVDIAFVLGAIDEYSHLNALFQLGNLISQPEFRQALRESAKPPDVLRTIWTFSSQRESPPNGIGGSY